MSLEKYWRKRNFDKTPEPKGRGLKTSKNRFVVQEHWASHHHFDFRLEMPAFAKASAGKPASAEASADKDVVLRSWAVPKGVPEKKGKRVLAIQTEDHPVSYLNFKGEIPEGCYGAGIVKIFDKGKYELIERTENKIVFELEGKKLRGKYTLLKFKKPNQWLLFKNE
ncbi:MAG: 3'-phosphoesterase [Candidatus Nealsonbacteria bacterium]|nr:MAG: 3'-phosphoesterase [Candidatus Nealsonbacteria bacterium]